jgi:hypothetical protein
MEIDKRHRCGYDESADNHQKEHTDATDEFITRLFCSIDQDMGPVKKYADELLYASEVVTLMVLFAIKGGRYRA